MNKTKKVTFADIERGYQFRYDGDVFVKTDARIAWEIRNGERYKEWCFNNSDAVKPIASTVNGG